MNKVSELKIDVQGMRDKILDLAIRGKLVSQDENDEPASVLLEKIAREKEQLIKEKKIKKTKPLPEITAEEKPFDIPDSWEWVRLGEVVELKSGKTEKAFNSKDKKFKAAYFKISDMNSVVNRKFARTSHKNIYLKNQDDIIPVNSIIFPKRGGAIKTNKKRIVRNPFLVIDMNLMAAIPFLNSLSSWIEIYFRKLNLGKLSNGSNVPQINNKDIEPLLFPLPPLNEQKRIATKIEELFGLLDIIEESTKKYESLQIALKEKILSLGMQGKLVEHDENDEGADELYEKIQSEKAQLIKEKKIKKTKPLPEITNEEKPFDIPESWKWVRLGEVTIPLQYGFTASAASSGNSRFVRITDIQNGQVNWEEVPYCNVTTEKLEKLKIKNGDILVARTGGTVGKSFVVDNLQEQAVFASYLIRIRLLNLNTVYGKVILTSPYYWNYISDKKSGTGQPNVNATKLSELLLPLPPLNEQKRIATKIDELFNTIDI